MAIYWYYPSKDALLDAVVEQLMIERRQRARARRPPMTGSTRCATLAHAYRRVAHDHPKAFPLLATRRFASEGTFAFLERLFELAREQGIDDKTTARFYRVVSSYCNGFALNELAAPRGPQDPRTAALRRRFARVAAVSEWLEPEHLDDDLRASGSSSSSTALAQAVRAVRKADMRYGALLTSLRSLRGDTAIVMRRTDAR